MYKAVTIPTGFPAIRELPYRKVISQALRLKYHTQEELEVWYTKFTCVRREKTRILWHKQSKRCVFCNCETWFLENPRKLSKRRMATLEHIVPQTNGGTDHMSNLIMSCNSCNNIRGVLGFMEFGDLRNDPEVWSTYSKGKSSTLRRQAAKLGLAPGSTRNEKREGKQNQFMFGLTLLWLYFPEYHQAMVDTYIEFKRRKDVVRETFQKRLESYPIDLLGDPLV